MTSAFPRSGEESALLHRVRMWLRAYDEVVVRCSERAVDDNDGAASAVVLIQRFVKVRAVYNDDKRNPATDSAATSSRRTRLLHQVNARFEALCGPAPAPAAIALPRTALPDGLDHAADLRWAYEHHDLYDNDTANATRRGCWNPIHVAPAAWFI